MPETAWGDRIKSRREELELTIEEFAARLDVHLATAYRWEGSEGDPRRSRMIQIATELGSDPCSLFFDEHGEAA